MGALLETPADREFKRCVCERADWRCERCHHTYQPEQEGLDCSHGYTRGDWAVRFCGLNAEALCRVCHSAEGGLARIRARLTDWELERLWEIRNDIGIGQLIKRTRGVGEIAAHYRAEYARMRALRLEGVRGRIEFEDWLP